MHYPVFLDLSGRHCVIIGGGDVAARRADNLVAAGARVGVIAPSVVEPLAELAKNGVVQLERRPYQDGDLAGADLVFAATDDAEVNHAVRAEARQRGAWANIADAPGDCDFHVPSIVRRDPVQVAISTGGRSPFLARLLRSRLELLVPAGFGKLAELVASLRAEVRQALPDRKARRDFWEQAISGPVAELFLRGREREATERLRAALTDPSAQAASGEVFLVGGGPGEPDLLTFRALRLMQLADVVVYDRLVASELVELVRPEAERLYVGKARDQHTVPQAEINQLLIDRARAGQRVLRLKGGDPFIFGRGGEEIADLAAAGIPFQVVPGITAAQGCSSYAGIPLTHRDHAHSCVLVTGHQRDGQLDLDWPSLCAPRQTICVYMGIHSSGELSARLIENGLAVSTPVAIIERGTKANQRVLTTDLAQLPTQVESAEIVSPALFIIGDVVTLRETLAWFEAAH